MKPMKKSIKIIPLAHNKFEEAVDLVLKTGLDTRDEIEHHLKHLDAHNIALSGGKIIGVIGWYQDTVEYVTKAMGDLFPGTEAYWVGFFAVDEKFRGQGVGYALLKKLEKILMDKEVKKLWVSSVPETREYYKRQGFKQVKKGYIGGNIKHFMVKTLR